jgi:hypothetical protein
MQKHSFAHTFCAKTKHGRLKKGGASTANPKKNIPWLSCLPWHPCPLPLSPSPLPSSMPSPMLARQPCHHLHRLATLTLLVACHPAIALVVARPAPSSSLLLATLIAATVVATAITPVVTHPAPSSPSPSLLPPSPTPLSTLATLVAIVIALFVASVFTHLPPSSPSCHLGWGWGGPYPRQG